MIYIKIVFFDLLLFSYDILLVGTCNFIIAKLQGIRNNVHSDCEWEREYACISEHCVEEEKEPKEYIIMGHSDYFVKWVDYKNCHKLPPYYFLRF